MAKGKNRRRGERPTDGPDEPLRPLRVEGRCAYCVCEGAAGRMELPGPTKVDRERMRAGERIHYILMCPDCVRPVKVEDPWLPRDSGRNEA